MNVTDLVRRIPKGLFIGGSWESREQAFPVYNPATGEVIAEVADASATDGLAALDAAVAVREQWAATEPRVRGELLRAAYTRIHERADDFAWTMTLEMGKPLAEAHGEVNYGAEFFRWFSEEAVRIDGRYAVAPSGRARILTMKQPVGPVYAITPWNFPLAMGTRKIGPALAAGCTVVVKPASATPLTTLLLMDVLAEVGLPAGVVNCVTTSRSGAVSAPLLADPRLRKLTFTGSTEVGRGLLAQAADRVLRTSMELGGNAPFLVLPSADLDRAVAGAVAAKMRNIGEACTAANRFLVHASVAAEFSTRLADALAAMTVGDGTRDGVQVGPLIDEDAVARVEGLIADAVGKGARVLTGGARVDGPGSFLQPTVLGGVSADARVMTEEIFGPVAPVTTFETLDEAVALANGSEFGLIAYVYGQDLDEALSVVERLETGMVGLNSGVVSNPAAPFGGVKSSGLGREGSYEGIEEYLETKYVGVGLA
ncbi:NAD-dependent succinate-semialdehyde dehydrogenase [Propionicicella superfundia]|uniref:NAD-dependent succinate-semialdehyde dehydrogenase n=1 Tax=Propionicicella superfundia TaxID=348582 RepID=UPI00041D4D0A|nr:NAD-dependent succinate-semialdehyde dehydrogenase [Propionicicella superfundia]